MATRKDIYKDAKGFDKNPQNINRNGRPRKTISVVNTELEANGYTEATYQEIKSCYLRLLNIDIPELQKMVGANDQPALVRIVGKSILSGKGFDVIEGMLNRSIGKAVSNVDVKSGGEKLNTTNPLQMLKDYVNLNREARDSDKPIN
jgi:hypothetical protein